MAVPATVIYFTCYDQLRDFLRYGLGFQGNHIPLVAGGLARCECDGDCCHSDMKDEGLLGMNTHTVWDITTS